MEWWNFQNKEFLIFFIIIVVIVVAVFAFSLSFSIYQKFYLNYRNKIKAESNSTRIYIINIKKNTVTFFNRADLRRKKTMDLLGFYSHFHPNDVEKVKNWILSISIDPKQVEQYLEVDVLLNKNKTTYYSILKLLKYN